MTPIKELHSILNDILGYEVIKNEYFTLNFIGEGITPILISPSGVMYTNATTYKITELGIWEYKFSLDSVGAKIIVNSSMLGKTENIYVS
ncbi:MAG: hypothetical protein J6T15_05125 [Bacilli bacterium]|nr:hypothetical protein [Bacilli bacterium]